jgi:hypothetical protein
MKTQTTLEPHKQSTTEAQPLPPTLAQQTQNKQQAFMAAMHDMLLDMPTDWDENPDWDEPQNGTDY